MKAAQGVGCWSRQEGPCAPLPSRIRLGCLLRAGRCWRYRTDRFLLPALPPAEAAFGSPVSACHQFELQVGHCCRFMSKGPLSAAPAPGWGGSQLLPSDLKFIPGGRATKPFLSKGKTPSTLDPAGAGWPPVLWQGRDAAACPSVLLGEKGSALKGLWLPAKAAGGWAVTGRPGAHAPRSLIGTSGVSPSGRR